MKVVINKKVCSKKATYPRLMIGDKGSVIEVFTEPDESGCAYVIVRESRHLTVGELQSSFRVIVPEGNTTSERFSDFDGSIALYND